MGLTVASVVGLRPRLLLPTRALRALSVLALIVVALLAGPAAWASAEESPERAKKAKDDVTLVYSWPEEGFEMWLPPQQGKLEFSGPVKTSTMQLTLSPLPGSPEPPGSLTRLTRGDSVEVVLFKFPELTEGSYVLKYKAEAVAGKPVEGSVTFSLGPEFTAPGGGNHRHGGSHIEYDSAWAFSLRVLVVLAAALLLFASYRRSRGFLSLFDAVVPRMGGLLLVLYAALAGGTAVVVAAGEYPDEPLTGVLASPALWVFLPMFAAGAIIAVSGMRNVYTAAIAVLAVLMSAFATQHGDQVWAAIATAAFAAACLAATSFIAWLMVCLSDGVASERRQSAKRALYAGLSLAVLALGSFGLLLAHARGLTLEGDFAYDVRVRAASLAVAALGYGMLLAASRISPRPLRRALVSLAFLVSLSGSAALLWIPPPASGL